MLKIKEDVPLVNLIDMGFKSEPYNIFLEFEIYVDKNARYQPPDHRERYGRIYDDIEEVYFLSDKRELRCALCDSIFSWAPKMDSRCIRDLVQKGYVEEI